MTKLITKYIANNKKSESYSVQQMQQTCQKLSQVSTVLVFSVQIKKHFYHSFAFDVKALCNEHPLCYGVLYKSINYSIYNIVVCFVFMT